MPDRRGPDWLTLASRVSCSSSGAGPSRAMPSPCAAARYLRTVSRDNPVPAAIWRWLCPTCHRRMIPVFPFGEPPGKPSLHLVS